MDTSFVMRANERGYNKLISTGDNATYIAGHPDATLTRHSSFNFGPYLSGRANFGRLRAFGDETFSGAGCGYNIHRHHNFIICAFVLQGQLTHVNTVGNVDQLSPGDFYAFSADSGGKHCELNLKNDDLHVIYIWMLPVVPAAVLFTLALRCRPSSQSTGHARWQCRRCAACGAGRNGVTSRERPGG
jgi:hypothetical protein